MKRIIVASLLLLAVFVLPAVAAEEAFDRMLLKFDYDTRVDMKATSKQLLKLLEKKRRCWWIFAFLKRPRPGRWVSVCSSR